MKLHLPKALLTAVVAAGLAFSSAYAEGIGNSYDSTYTYGGTVYTLGSPKGDTLADLYETTRSESEPGKWEESSTASTKTWTSLYASEGGYNTLRITDGIEYGFKFKGLTFAGLIVEADADGASFKGIGGGDRNTNVGKSGVEAQSYFGGSFTFDCATASSEATTFTLAGKQDWYIADGKTVTLTSKNSVVNNAAWTINGGTVAINHTIDNANGSITAGHTTFQISDLGALKNQLAESWSDDMTQNGTVSLNKTYFIAKGGTASLTGSNVKYMAEGREQTQTLTTGSFTHTHSGYGVVNDASLADIVEDVNNGGGSFIAIKEGVTLSKGSGATFTVAQKLTGAGKYDLGQLANGTTLNASVLGSDISFDDEWTGTVSLSGGVLKASGGNNNNQIKDIDFNVLGRVGSTVEIASGGLYGYFKGGTQTYNPNILLTGNLYIQDGGSTDNKTFAGDVSGDGSIYLRRTGGGDIPYTFSGNIAGWKGSLVVEDNNGATADLQNNITLTGNATVVNAAIDRQSGILNLTVNNNGKTTAFNKNVTVNKLTANSAIALGEGVALTLTGSNDASSISNITAATGGNTITLQSGATLNRIATKSGGTITLKGAGAYNLNGSFDSNVSGLSDAQNWTGKVVMSGSKNGLNFNDYSNNASTIEIASAGYSGHLENGNTTYGANFIMSGDITVNNGWGDQTKTFAGAMSSSGTFKLAYTGAASTTPGSFIQSYTFTGDVSGWEGNFVVQDVADKQASKGTLTFSGTSEINLASIAAKKADTAEGAARSELHVTISDADQGETKSAVTVAGTIDATSLTTNTTNGVVLNNDVTVGSMTVQNGTVSGSGNITVNNTLTVNAADSIQLAGSLLFGDGATLTLSDSLAQTIVNGTQTSYTLAIAGDITEGVQLTTALNLDGSKFTDCVLSVQDYVSTQARSGDTAGKALVLTLTPMAEVLDTLTVTSVGTYDATENVLTLNTQLVEGAFELGTELDVAFTGDTWEEALAAIVGAEGDAAEVSVQFTMANGELIDLTGVTSLTVNGIAPVGGVTVIEGTKASAYLIPEPTTSTLSLLALAALAVRRRRR